MVPNPSLGWMSTNWQTEDHGCHSENPVTCWAGPQGAGVDVRVAGVWQCVSQCECVCGYRYVSVLRGREPLCM